MILAEKCEVKYSLVIKNDVGSYAWLHSCVSASSNAAARAELKLF